MRTLGVLLVLVMTGNVWAGHEATHTKTVKSKHVTVHYRPGSRAGSHAGSIARDAEQALARVCTALGVTIGKTVEVVLYDHVAELAAINKLTGVGGFASGDHVHVPLDNRQTLEHEIAHVITHRLPKSGDEVRNMFYVEGMANALLEYVHGVHVHAVAKFYCARRKLPPLSEMTSTKDFYAWGRAHPGLNAYDVGASWMRYLIDTQGMPKVIRYYTGTNAEKAFGAGIKTLEASWHKSLDAFIMRKEVETLLKRRHGEPAVFDDYPLQPFDRLPADVRGKESDWKSLAGAQLQPAKNGSWARKGSHISGVTTSMDWSWCQLGRDTLNDAVITATLRPSKGCVGVAVRFGDAAQALLVSTGTFLYTAGDRGVGANKEERLVGRDTVELTMTRRDATVRIYVDGVFVLEGQLKGQGDVPGVGIAGGSVTVEAIRVRLW